MSPAPTLGELETKYFPSMPTVVPHSGDTEVSPHVDGRSYFASLMSAIDATGAPGDVIYLANWLFVRTLQLTPTSASDIGTLLAEKAAAGVDVRIIVWTGRFALGGDRATGPGEAAWWSSFVPFTEHVTVVVASNIENALALRALTVPGATTPPLNGRVLMDWGGSGVASSRHQKYAVVYRRAAQDLRAFVGGLDIAPQPVQHSSPGHPVDERWHDAGVELRGGAAASVWRDFRTRWAEARSLISQRFRIPATGASELFNPYILAAAVPDPDTVPRAPVTSTSGVRIVRSYDESRAASLWGQELPWSTLPPGGLREIKTLFLTALGNAARYIYVEDQGLNIWEPLISHYWVYQRIAEAANRGVKIIFVCPGPPDPTDATKLSNEWWVGTLESSLIRYISFANRSNFVMHRVDHVFVHAKLVLVDDEFCSVGSANFWDRSMSGYDTELSAAVVDAASPSLVQNLRVRLWAEHLGVDMSNPTVAAELGDLNKSLALFDPGWGTGVSFPTPDSRLTKVKPPPA